MIAAGVGLAMVSKKLMMNREKQAIKSNERTKA
jgi:hypothetical protein